MLKKNILNEKSLFMRLSILFLMVITLVIFSCAQQQNKPEQTIPKEQIKPVIAQKIKMSVDGMVCSACQSTVRKTIKSLNGVKDVEVSLENKIAFITYYPNLIKPEQIHKAINDKGAFKIVALKKG